MQFNFTVILESSKALPERPWEVSIWYDHGSYIGLGQKTPWEALDLQRVTNAPTELYNSDDTNYRYCFSGNLPSPFTSTTKVYKGRRVLFTVRYRIDSNSEWQWAYHNFQVPDGELILQPPIDPNFLGAAPIELKPGWVARKINSEAPEARLYSIESSEPIPPSLDSDAQTHHAVLGRVLQPCRWFALVRIWTPWLAPRHGGTQFHLSEPAILLSFLRSDGLHVVLLPVNGIDDALTTFRSTDEGEIRMELRNDSVKPRKFRTIAASAWSFEVALAAVMYEMRKLVRESPACIELTEHLPKEIKDESVESEPDTVIVSSAAGPQEDPSPTPQWLQSWYDSLAYCTWNSLGQDLNQDKVLRALDAFADIDVHFSTIIIDDNWQSLTGKQGKTTQFERGWTKFEAHDGFPGGLSAFTSAVRKKHPSVHDIAVWHALMGYWGFIAPEGSIAQDYKTRQILLAPTCPAAPAKLAVDPSDIHRMYRDFYAFLSSSGITAVKTDVQFMLDELSSTKDRREFTNAYLSAWTQAHLSHLSGKAISCMSSIPQILFHSFLPTNTPRVMLRNSDDFFPDVVDSHAWHVFTNAHNALLTQHLNVLGDWDMFQTSHPYSGFHAASRCLSGGPIYITDTPGQHDVDLIHEISAINSRGQTVILRPSMIGKTVGVYDRYDDRSVLKIGSYDGRRETGTGMLGVFNIADKEISFVLPITKIPGLAIESGAEMKEGRWIVRSHGTKRITKPLTPVVPFTPETLLEGKLGVRGHDIWSALPVHLCDLGEAKVDVAVLGLIGKMTGACAIIDSRFSTAESGRRLKIAVQLKALGKLGVWINDASTKDGEDRWKAQDMMVLIQGRAIPESMVNISAEGIEKAQPGARVIEVDVLGAWRQMQLEPGWSNEVGVEIFVS